MNEDVTVILLGVTGDLALKKLIPSLYSLYQKKEFSKFVILGVSNEATSAQAILNKAKTYVKNLKTRSWNTFSKQFFYHKTDFTDKKTFCDLGPVVRTIEKEHGLSGNRLFYLATLPKYFKIITSQLDECGLSKQTKKNWTRVVYEKPFGDNLNSAKKINACIQKVFSEDQIYRIDHYLGKELVQNISITRFTNMLLEPQWNNEFIDHVQILLSETEGVGTRANFYDSYGALKDVVQNHMLQLLALVAMDSPKRLDANSIRNEKVSVLKKTKLVGVPLLGQYTGYKKKVGKKSGTETCVAAEFAIENKRWKGVPFYMLTGKQLPKRTALIYVEFKQAPCDLFTGLCNHHPNYFVFQIQPQQGLYMGLNAKQPGTNIIKEVVLDFCHECEFGPNTPKAYENLLLDVVIGDQSVFVRGDEIEQQWNIIDSVKRTKKFMYAKKSFPKELTDFMSKRKKHWHLGADVKK